MCLIEMEYLKQIAKIDLQYTVMQRESQIDLQYTVMQIESLREQVSQFPILPLER